MSGWKFTELYPDHDKQIQNYIAQLLRNKQ
jgi:hypothetical protein